MILNFSIARCAFKVKRKNPEKATVNLRKIDLFWIIGMKWPHRNFYIIKFIPKENTFSLLC